MRAYSHSKIAIRFIWYIVILPGIPFLLFSLLFLFYSHWPRDFQNVKPINLTKTTESVVILVHGVKDSPEHWGTSLSKIIQQRAEKSSTQIIYNLDWQSWSDNVMTCSVFGRNIGKRLGRQILENKSVRRVHAIGHSCGAFVVLGICESLRTAKAEIEVQSTFLDPVSVYSGLWWNYGHEHFGKCADFSDAWIDTEDSVPGSNQKLKYAHTFDVTGLRKKAHKHIPPHNWPFIYYQYAYEKGLIPLLNNNISSLKQQYPQNKLSVPKYVPKDINELNISQRNQNMNIQSNMLLQN